MSRHLFGWDLPPGVSMRDIDPPEQPCAVCGAGLDDCLCPECDVCQSVGDPACYQKHGLVRTEAQIASLAKHEAELATDAQQTAAAEARQHEGEE